MNRKIRAAVVARSDGLCEACFRWVGDEGHADHFFGRAKADETEANVWMLCGPSVGRAGCDDDKTHNRPSAAVWMERFALHASLYGFKSAAERATAKLSALRAKGRA